MPEPLSRDVVHVWFAQPPVDVVPSDDLAILSEIELERAGRFRHADMRRLYVTAHGLVRRVLSRYAPVDPAEWEFTIEGQGKPRIESPAEFRWLQFNLSHTQDLAACSVSRDVPVGVDVENVHRRRRTRSPQPKDCLPLARHCLADREFAPLPDLELAERWVRFLRHWTLKESYLKACGSGISQPLQEFAFSWDRERPRIEFLAGQDDGGRWSFAEYRFSEIHLAAVAVPAPVREVLWRTWD